MSIQGSGGNPTFPAQWLYGLSRALPGEPILCCHRRLRAFVHWTTCDFVKLDASIRGVRTTRFCRTPSCRSLFGTTSVHRDPSPRFVAIMIRPPERDGMDTI